MTLGESQDISLVWMQMTFKGLELGLEDVCIDQGK